MNTQSLSPASRAGKNLIFRVPGVACFALTPGYCLSRLRREITGLARRARLLIEKR